jgi:hypothetical protein
MKEENMPHSLIATTIGKHWCISHNKVKCLEFFEFDPEVTLSSG